MTSTNGIKIKLPNVNGEPVFIENKTSVVLIGANGSGKTRMSIFIEQENQTFHIHRISAQKSLNMPKSTKTTDLKSSQDIFLFGTVDGNIGWRKNAYRWGNEPAIHLLDDFDVLMQLLFTEAFQQMLLAHNQHIECTETKLDTIKKIWETVIINKSLNIEAGKIEVSNKISTSEVFNGADMSDGERAIFYFIGEALCVPENSAIIVDEPENHLHKAILVRLWNAIESARPDCMFIYITHDLDFAVSRSNSQIVWVQDMPYENSWNYQVFSEDFPIDELSLEIYGSRQDVLLVEGTAERLDCRLYSLIFPKYNVIAVGSCDSVISYTKAFYQLSGIHYCTVRGIVDRDRRSDEEIHKLNQNRIFCPEVAEIENLFLLPEVIKLVTESIQYNAQQTENILNNVKKKTFEFLSNHLDEQALLFTRQEVQNKISVTITGKFNTIDEYKNAVNSALQATDIDAIHELARKRLQKIIDDSDYYEALKVINDKALLPYTGLTNALGWKIAAYTDHVLRLLSSAAFSEKLISIFREYIKIP